MFTVNIRSDSSQLQHEAESLARVQCRLLFQIEAQDGRVMSKNMTCFTNASSYQDTIKQLNKTRPSVPPERTFLNWSPLRTDCWLHVWDHKLMFTLSCEMFVNGFTRSSAGMLKLSETKKACMQTLSLVMQRLSLGTVHVFDVNIWNEKFLRWRTNDTVKPDLNHFLL